MSGVNLAFGGDTRHALRGAAALVNTMAIEVKVIGTKAFDSMAVDTVAASAPGDTADRLTTVEDLDAFVATWRWSGSRTHDEPELRAVRALRPRLRAWWVLDEGALVDAVNATLAEAQAQPQLVDHDGWGWHLHASPASAPLATRMAVEAAMAFVDLIRVGELDRLNTCAAPDCDSVVVDLSKNRSRRYCDGGCGNRAAVAAYRQRRRGAVDGGGVGAETRATKAAKNAPPD
ncbi:MAG: CGNR zinc finger domain-containing protein [Dermatophilaceae bacterium]